MTGRDYDGGPLYQESGSPLFDTRGQSPIIQTLDELEELLKPAPPVSDADVLAASRLDGGDNASDDYLIAESNR